MNTSKRIAWALGIVVVFAGVGFANWSDSFDGGKLNLSTWQFLAFPQVTGTFKQTITAGEGGNYYLAFTETVTSSKGGAAFGAGFGSSEKFKDVRVGATVDVAGDACHNYYGLIARASYFVDPDGKLTGVAPGVVADCYIMHIDYSKGPANLALDLEKVVMNQNMMDKDIGVVIPQLANARSYYAELEVVGSGPVYVTGRLYEFKGGPLVAQTPTMVDTDAKDPWEDANKRDKVFTEGISGIFAQNEDEEPVGFYLTWDDVSSVSDGPTAVILSPADGATGVSMQATLRWVEAGFATSRQLWLGTPGNLALVDPAPTGASYVTGLLEPGQTYQWRVDQVGATGTVTGHTWQFTTGQGLAIDDFESYADNAAIAAAWPHNIAGYDYVLLETSVVNQGAKAMSLGLQNQYEPFFTEATRTLAAPQDWTAGSPDQLSISFRGKADNVEQKVYVRVEDAAGNQATVANPLMYAIQTEYWRTWDIALTEFTGVDLTAVKKLTIGAGTGTDSGQSDKDEDTLYIDNIRLSFAP
jgi:hypothetical protein